MDKKKPRASRADNPYAPRKEDFSTTKEFQNAYSRYYNYKKSGRLDDYIELMKSGKVPIPKRLKGVVMLNANPDELSALSDVDKVLAKKIAKAEPVVDPPKIVPTPPVTKSDPQSDQVTRQQMVHLLLDNNAVKLVITNLSKRENELMNEIKDIRRTKAALMKYFSMQQN